jgi:hypothetical protein
MEDSFGKQIYIPNTAKRANLKVLAKFDSNKKASQKPPKKEYLRCKLIRGHKRAIRQIISGMIPKATINKFETKDLKAYSTWVLLKKIVLANREIFSTLSKTEAGPLTDGRAKRLPRPETNSPKSFNFNFSKNYFSIPTARESFFTYINLIFVNFNPEALCKKFDFYCCRFEIHNIECMEKWNELYKYITQDMLEELSLEPFIATNKFLNLPKYSIFSNFLNTDNDFEVNN